MCLGGFAPWSMALTMDSRNRRSSKDERKHLLPSKPALVKNNSRPFRKEVKKVAFVPTLEDVHDSLSRKEYRASLPSLSDRATMGTVDFEHETASSSFSNISLLAEAGSTVRGSSINDASRLESSKQTTTSHVRNVSNTAVFDDETTILSDKEPHRWTFEDSGPCTDSALSRQNSDSDFSTTTHLHTSLHTLAGNMIVTHGSGHIDGSPRSSQVDKVSDARLIVDKNDYSTRNSSYTRASTHQTPTEEALNKKNASKKSATQPTASTSGPPSINNSVPFAPESAGASAQAIKGRQSAEQRRCCIGVLSAFEEEFLSDEDKQAILEGGCHGLCTVQPLYRKSSPPARGPSDRPARFISPMPSDIMSNGRRGEYSTLPRFSRRRVAAEYKRPRSPIGLVEHPSRKASGRSGNPLAQPYSMEQTDHTYPRNAIWDSNDELIDLSSLGRNQRLFLMWCRPKRKLKKQSKHDDLRQEFESHDQLAEEVIETVEAKEDDEAVQGEEKSSLSRKFFRRLRALI
ncbi:hypothetical protein KCU65_g5700, partial [Aureobasidium melanogenum]